MSRIAKDYLTIQGSAVPSERIFSSSNITATAHRNALLPETFGALQVLKSAYCQGHISAITQAELAVPRASSLIVSISFLPCSIFLRFFVIKMAGSVVQTGSEPEPDPMELNPVVQF